MKDKPQDNRFYNEIIGLLQSARSRVVRAVNRTMVITYFEIGRLIVEEEQDGEDRAAYGKQLLKELSKKLTNIFGKGFSVDNLEKMRRFFIAYEKSATLLRISDEDVIATPESIIEKYRTLPDEIKKKNQKVQTTSAESDDEIIRTSSGQFNLSWSHYLLLMRLGNKKERQFYEIEAFKNSWSVRELQRQ